MAEENKTVDVDTDNLDDFNDLWEGRASTKPVEGQEIVEEPQDSDPAEAEEAEEEIDVNEEPADDSGATDDEDEEQKPAPKKNSAQERIDELTKKWREAERELERIKAESQSKQEKPEQKETEEPETESKAPDHTDKDKYPLGDLDPQYQADMIDYKLEARLAQLDKQREAERQKDAAIARAEAMQADWDAKMATAEEKYEDYRETVQSLESAFEGVNPEHGQFIAETIMGMENGTDVLYELAKNPDAAKALASSDPVNAALALGRLEASLTSEPAPKKVTRKESKAPKPPANLNKGNSPRFATKPDTDDLDAFEDVFFDKK